MMDLTTTKVTPDYDTTTTVIETKKKLSFSVASLLEHAHPPQQQRQEHVPHHDGLDRLKEEAEEEDEDEEDGYTDEDIDPGHEEGEAVSPPPSLPHHPLPYPHPALLAMQKDAQNGQQRLFNMFPQGISHFNQAMFRSGRRYFFSLGFE